MGRLAPTIHGVIYGPVRSRRLGVSLGINILPPEGKTCNFNCPYCQYGWTRVSPNKANPWPTPEMIVTALSERLWAARARGECFDRLTLAGRGEPTLHPRFAEVVQGLRAVRDRASPGTPLAILSNSSTADRPSVRAALLDLDERYMKLDAGDPMILRWVNGSPIWRLRIAAALRALPDIVIQSMFVRDPAGRIDNSGDAAVTEWVRAVSRIGPRKVYLCTLDRPPASAFIRPVPDARLLDIAGRVRDIGVPARAFLSNC